MSRLLSVAFENFFIEKKKKKRRKIYCISANTSGTYTKSHFQDLKLRVIEIRIGCTGLRIVL